MQAAATVNRHVSTYNPHKTVGQPGKPPVHDTATSQQQPADGYQSHVDLSPDSAADLTTSSPAKPDEPLWRDCCNRLGLKAGDDDIAPLLAKPNETQKPLLEEDGKFCTRAIYSREGILQRALIDQALLMQTRNYSQEDLYEALRNASGEKKGLQALQNEYNNAHESGAPGDLLNMLDGKIQALKGCVDRANEAVREKRADLEKTQQNVEFGQQKVVAMLKGKVPARRLLGPDGQLAAPIHPLRAFLRRYPATVFAPAMVILSTAASFAVARTVSTINDQDPIPFDPFFDILCWGVCVTAGMGVVMDRLRDRFDRERAAQ